MAISDREQIIRTAAGMAASGKYAAAESLLDQLDETQATANTWRLRAKIAAQQKQFDSAISLWHKVLQEDPKDSEAQDAIRLAERMKNSRSPEILLRSRLYGVILAAVVLVCLITVTAIAWRGPAEEEFKDISDLPAFLSRQQEQLQLNRDAIQALDERQVQLAQKLSAELGLLQGALGISGNQARADTQLLSEAVKSVAESSQHLEEQLRQNTDALSAKVETLTATTRTLEDRLLKNDGQLLLHVQALGESTQQSKTQLDARITQVDEGMSQLVTRAKNIEEQLQSDRVAWDQKVELVAKAVAQLDARTLAGKEALATDIQRLEVQLQSDRAAWDQKAESLVQAVTQLDARTAEGKEALARDIQRIEGQLQSDRAAWNRKVESLVQAVAQLDARTAEGEEFLARSIESTTKSTRQQHDTLVSELKALSVLQKDQAASLALDIEALRQDQRNRLTMVRAELGRALMLTEQMRKVAANYRRLERKLWGPNKAERREALEQIRQLETAVEVLSSELQRGE